MTAKPIITAFTLRPSQRGEMLTPGAWHASTWRGKYDAGACAYLAEKILEMAQDDWKAYGHASAWPKLFATSEGLSVGFSRRRYHGPRQELLDFFTGKYRWWFERLAWGLDCDPDMLRRALYIR